MLTDIYTKGNFFPTRCRLGTNSCKKFYWDSNLKTLVGSFGLKSSMFFIQHQKPSDSNHYVCTTTTLDSDTPLNFT